MKICRMCWEIEKNSIEVCPNCTCKVFFSGVQDFANTHLKRYELHNKELQDIVEQVKELVSGTEIELVPHINDKNWWREKLLKILSTSKAGKCDGGSSS